MNAQQDITQHPLYRPHHGDMTGWRYLENTESILEGDECNTAEHENPRHLCIWSETMLAGDMPKDCPNNVYRRRISPALNEAEKRCPKCGAAESDYEAHGVCKAETKRFVTVVYEATPDNLAHIETLKAFGETIQIREGNYLDKFDKWKERVNKAMENIE